MKSFLIAATITITTSCYNQFSASIQKTNSPGPGIVSEVMDFEAKRLSGARVLVSWHAQPGQVQNDFLVMRRLGSSGILEKVGTVKPKRTGTLNDYTITDLNECEDSSFYSLMQVDGKGVKYFSQFKGVKGVRK